MSKKNPTPLVGEPLLGDRLRDRITGFQGIAIAKTDWLNQCVRWTIQSEERTDNGKSITETFDEIDVELIAVDPLGYRAVDKKVTGGPRPEPVRQRA